MIATSTRPADHIITTKIHRVRPREPECLINQREAAPTRTRSRTRCAPRCGRIPIFFVGELRDSKPWRLRSRQPRRAIRIRTLHTTTGRVDWDRVIERFRRSAGQIRDHALGVATRRHRADAAGKWRRTSGGARSAESRRRRSATCIAKGDISDPSIMQVSKGGGMVTLNDALLDLVTKKLVAPDEALAKAVDKTGFEALSSAPRGWSAGSRRPPAATARVDGLSRLASPTTPLRSR